MIGIAILTHGLFGEELYRTSEMIVGKQDDVEIIDMQAGSSINDVTERLNEAVNTHKNSGLLVFTDMFGGSPSNISMAYFNYDSVEVVSGVNLPMLLKAFSMRMDNKYNINDIAAESALAGINNIKVAGNILNKSAKAVKA